MPASGPRRLTSNRGEMPSSGATLRTSQLGRKVSAAAFWNSVYGACLKWIAISVKRDI